ncbi:Ribosomal RNA small subunit methyltransferase H [Fundidesulfovibrio magnetotacticus]|uniref:Ribosomal RNA small subunit methyltransferase H n=1 Tax=Fundidesulfovibrio magnetotacticus TaxID=2730080 RepID=A0A6V8LTX5_9BACT|nr:16S rRNA (cytosine(1402)-N(4))-methyltransferase RsmH [Fundidesulfovibrio magnetotacticus]GFK93559.1 Ribosomal RNA small subunit methyltransferase H [Fundidesulfovibrio magnetotacticus]
MRFDPRHLPVLHGEVCDMLGIRPGMRVLDATLGLGGHSRAMLEKAGGELEILGLDRDPTAVERALANLADFPGRVQARRMRFSEFPAALEELGWDSVDAALADVGVSSPQLDEAERGFSFLADGPLDMRMSVADGLEPAANIVNNWSFERLRDLIRDYGEEPQAGRIARAITRERETKPFDSTLELARVVERAYPPKWRATARNHPATRTFQALRMAVNEELQELEDFLDRIVDHLSPGGRVAVISFHSLEDRLVKTAFRREASGCLCPPRQPFCTCGHVPRLRILTKKPLGPSEAEAAANHRARSAKLRVAQRLAPEGAPLEGFGPDGAERDNP